MGWEKSGNIQQKLVGLREIDKKIVRDYAEVDKFKGSGESFSNALRRLLQEFNEINDLDKRLDKIEKRIKKLEKVIK